MLEDDYILTDSHTSMILLFQDLLRGVLIDNNGNHGNFTHMLLSGVGHAVVEDDKRS